MAKFKAEKATRTYTYQTRLHGLSHDVESTLNKCAELFSRIERNLYSDYRRGLSIAKQKNIYLIKYGITARQFNAIRITLQGKIDSVLALNSGYIANTKVSISSKEKAVKILKSKKEKGSLTLKQLFKLHQFQRGLINLQIKLKKLEADKENKLARICFGGKQLFNSQFNLEQNKLDCHSEWLSAWQAKRSSQFYFIGSRDEATGNQSCVITFEENNSFGLRIRLPDSLIGSRKPKFVVINNIRFQYGHDTICQAVLNNIKRNKMSRKTNRQLHGDIFKELGQAISYRFARDSKGWRIFVTTELDIKPKTKTESKQYGAIGVDINVNHLAITEVDNTGNFINCFNVPCNTYGKTSNQAKAIVGYAVKQLVEYATLKNKAIVIEKLDFQKKKQQLKSEEVSKRQARLLSSFNYQLITEYIKSKAYRNAIALHLVNPAYSSVIGRVKFASIYPRLSVHTSAAMVIARRFLGFSERLPKSWDNIPDDTGSHVTLPELVKIQGRHVWYTWAKGAKKLKAVLVAQHQTMRRDLKHLALTTRLNKESSLIPF